MTFSVYNKQKQKLYTIDNNKEIARGGEGYLVVIPTNKDLVAKIYLPNCLNINESKFIHLNKLDGKYFIKPQELLYDKSGQKILGITMQYLPQTFFPLDVIFNKSYCLKNNINISVKEKITNNLIEAVKSAHALGIDIGDLSGLNVMIENDGNVKLIDVDSYQVPGIKHSNKLLEEIRDYLYGGNVSKQSDYFALSVIVFNYLTYLHPFKGVHKKYAKLSERMVKKIPVFFSDPDLIIPKCYEKIHDKFLADQYDKLYCKGDRFLLSINKLIAPVIGTPVAQQMFKEKDVIIQNVFSGEIIEYAYFSNTTGMIRTKKEFIFYDTNTNGMIFKRAVFLRDEWKDFFIGEENIVGVKGDSLFNINIVKGTSEQILNFKTKTNARFIHMNNILIMLENEFMWKINIDKIKYNNVLVDKQNVYGQGFKTYSGVIQNVGGINYIYTNIHKKLNQLKSPKLILGYSTIEDVGILKYEENKQIKYSFFNITDANINIIKEVNEFYHFAYRGTNYKDAFLFASNDNKIDIFRAIDFQKLAEIECSVIALDTRLFNTKSGIIALNENQLFLINKK